MACHVTSNERLEDVGVADLPHAAHGAFRFKPIDRRLNRGVSRSWLRKLLLDFPDRGFPKRPQHLENLQFQSRKLWLFSGHLLSRLVIYYQIVVSVKVRVIEAAPRGCRLNISRARSACRPRILERPRQRLVPPVLLDGIFAHTERLTQNFEAEIPIPNITCPNCVLQVIEFMADHPGIAVDGGHSYHHCAILNITADPAKPIDKRW